MTSTGKPRALSRNAAQIGLRHLRPPGVFGKPGGIRLARHDVAAADLLDGAIRVHPRAGGHFAQVRDAAQDAHLDIERLAAAVVRQPPALEPAQLVLQREIPVHLRRDRAEDLRRGAARRLRVCGCAGSRSAPGSACVWP